jgi:thermitase
MGIRTKVGLVFTLFVAPFIAFGAAQKNQEYLVKLTDVSVATQTSFLKAHGGTLELVSIPGQLFKWTTEKQLQIQTHHMADSQVLFIEPNRKLHLFSNPSIIANKEAIQAALGAPTIHDAPPYPDNPPIEDVSSVSVTAGTDPLLVNAWGMQFIDAPAKYTATPAGEGVIVAVIDTGIDYNHEDLIANIWHNAGEIPNNNIDDDNNGYVDDVIGWDWVQNDNKPYDLIGDLNDILNSGANPGHGTHCSGNVAATFNNSKGSAGVAPNAKVMPLRFLDQTGSGDTANAVKAIDYATQMGANIISASWGSDGQDPNDAALREAVQRAGTKGILFVVAAGNGHQDAGTGYDNDTDPNPTYPAAYGYDNMVAVAAIDSTPQLASFSNWGEKTVIVGAPGVKILSTVPGNRYQDTIASVGGQDVTWDGTSMATPFVAGALAVIWSTDKTQTAAQVRSALMAHVVPEADLQGKTVTGGHIDLSWVKAQ